MNIYEFDDYKAFFLSWMAQTPGGGRGQFRKLSQHLNVSSVFITQVFRGDRELSFDQAFETAEFVGATDLEIDYFLLLVQEARAGGYKLKARLKKKRQALRREVLDLKKQIAQDAELSFEAKSQFYGHWHYSAIRLLCSIPEYRYPEAIAKQLQIPLERVQQVLNFLTENQLVIQTQEGWKMGPKITHLEAGSPFIISRQVQWRTKGFEAMANQSTEDLFYTSPMSLDEETFLKIRGLLTETIKEGLKKVRDADSKMLVCLNIDWFRL